MIVNTKIVGPITYVGPDTLLHNVQVKDMTKYGVPQDNKVEQSSSTQEDEEA